MLEEEGTKKGRWPGVEGRGEAVCGRAGEDGERCAIYSTGRMGKVNWLLECGRV